ncbi:hypothetical protein HYFRA_00004304 [Hymenoscyphus fraxineus]|uniref:Uncharacterized protein n=1 Tax=Hymenoscyphus fraxineus TaxID=746836 RepID=A0A9N9PQ04_9HELO|nr:hypothetical protein HYFRA_00004304 [Hymenoscyphus fraxineus]
MNQDQTDLKPIHSVHPILSKTKGRETRSRIKGDPSRPSIRFAKITSLPFIITARKPTLGKLATYCYCTRAEPVIQKSCQYDTSEYDRKRFNVHRERFTSSKKAAWHTISQKKLRVQVSGPARSKQTHNAIMSKTHKDPLIIKVTTSSSTYPVTSNASPPCKTAQQKKSAMYTLGLATIRKLRYPVPGLRFLFPLHIHPSPGQGDPQSFTNRISTFFRLLEDP